MMEIDESSFLTVLMTTGINVINKTEMEIAQELYKKANKEHLREWIVEHEYLGLLEKDGADYVARHGFKGVYNFVPDEFIKRLKDIMGGQGTDHFMSMHKAVVHGEEQV